MHHSSGQEHYKSQSPWSSATKFRYRSPAMCAVLRQPKCVKLRALHSSCKFGVAARSCQELLRKGCVRFQVSLAFRASTAEPWFPPVRFPSSWVGLDGRWASTVPRAGCLEGKTVVGQADLLVRQLPVPGSRLCLYEDGTEVTDDRLPGLPNDAELLLLTAGETWHGCE